jgi:hypothetical protein
MDCFANLRVIMMLAAMLAFGIVPAVAQAKCGDVGPPSYADISAIMLEQNGCGSTIHAPTASNGEQTVTSFACSTYWVLFWNNGRHDVPTAYSQFNLNGAIGMYDLAATLDDARNILAKDKFFLLTPPDYQVMDAARSVLSVKRCAVVTRISIFNTVIGPEDIAAKKLFDDVRTLVEKSARTEKSSTPEEFGQTLLFDP